MGCCGDRSEHRIRQKREAKMKVKNPLPKNPDMYKNCPLCGSEIVVYREGCCSKMIKCTKCSWKKKTRK